MPAFHADRAFMQIATLVCATSRLIFGSFCVVSPFVVVWLADWRAVGGFGMFRRGGGERQGRVLLEG
jgi:hypothetical protein